MTSNRLLAIRLSLRAWRNDKAGLAFVIAGWWLSLLAVLLGIQVMTAMGHEQAVCNARSIVYAAPDQPGRGTVSVLDDRLGDQAMTRVLVVSGSDRLRPPPGIEALPQPGQAIVSPRLRQLAQADRSTAAVVGGTVAGTIRPDGLTSRDELFAYVGVRSVLDGTEIVAFGGAGSECEAYAPGTFEWAAFVMLVLAPALLVAWSVTKAAARRRAARFRAFNLLGISRSTCGKVGGWEMAWAALGGALAAVASYVALRTPLGETGLLGVSWFGGQVSISPGLLALVVAVALCMAVAIGTRVARAGAQGVIERRRGPGRFEAVQVRVAGGLALAALGALLWLWLKSPRAGQEYGPSVSLVFYLAMLLSVVGAIVAFVPLIRRRAAVGAVGDGSLTTRLAWARLAVSSRRALTLALALALVVLMVGIGLTLTHASRILGLGDGADWQVTTTFDPARTSLDRIGSVLGGDGIVSVGADRVSQPNDISGTPPLASISVGSCAAEAAAQSVSASVCAGVPANRAVRLVPADAQRDPEQTLQPGERLRIEASGKAVPMLTVPQDALVSDDINSWAGLLVPVRQATWLMKVGPVEATFAVPPGPRYERLLAAIRVDMPGSVTVTSVADDDALRRADRLQAALLGFTLITLALLLVLFIAAATETRIEQSRTRATLAALGVPRRTMLASVVVESAVPLVVATLYFVPVAVLAGQVFEAGTLLGSPRYWPIAWGTAGAAAAAILAAIVAALLGSIGSFSAANLRRNE